MTTIINWSFNTLPYNGEPVTNNLTEWPHVKLKHSRPEGVLWYRNSQWKYLNKVEQEIDWFRMNSGVFSVPYHQKSGDISVTYQDIGTWGNRETHTRTLNINIDANGSRATVNQQYYIGRPNNNLRLNQGEAVGKIFLAYIMDDGYHIVAPLGSDYYPAGGPANGGRYVQAMASGGGCTLDYAGQTVTARDAGAIEVSQTKPAQSVKKEWDPAQTAKLKFVVCTNLRDIILTLPVVASGIYDTNRLALSQYTYHYPEGTTDYVFGQTNDTSLSNTLNMDASSTSNWSR